MSSGNQHVFAAHLQKPLGALIQIRHIIFILIILRKPPRFQAVGCDDGRLRKQQFAHGHHHFITGKLVTAA